MSYEEPLIRYFFKVFEQLKSVSSTFIEKKKTKNVENFVSYEY